MYKRIIALALALLLSLSLFSGCGNTNEPSTTEPLPEEKVTLTIAGGWPDCRAIDKLASDFTTKYPNCTIVYEYLQDYYASLGTRLSGDSPVDLFFTTNIQSDSELLPYALDLNSCDNFDLSKTFDGLIKNFMLRGEDGDTEKLYAIPLGAEMRGMYVNTTLLKSLNIEVPTDQASLLRACQILKENGYTAFHGNPGSFSQILLYPWICNLIANADDPEAEFNKVEAHEEGISEVFREPLQFLYTLVENGYYDYKTAQTESNLFTETTDEAYACNFLNIIQNGDNWEKVDDLGQVAFMPAPMSLKSVIDKTKDDYHSEIEYTFIISPVGTDGGYAYMSPAHGIAAYKDSENLDWSVKFLDFLFQPENNKAFAELFNVIPNTEEAFSYITTLYDVPENHISHLGEVSFSYAFYDIMTTSMIDISKGNNPKYMQDDGSGNLSLYPLDYYMQQLEEIFKQQ